MVKVISKTQVFFFKSFRCYSRSISQLSSPSLIEPDLLKTSEELREDFEYSTMASAERVASSPSQNELTDVRIMLLGKTGSGT